MDIMSKLSEGMLITCGALIFIGFTVFLLLMELSFIKNRKKGEVLLPFIILCITAVCCWGWIKEAKADICQLKTIAVDVSGEEQCVQHICVDSEKQIVALGQLVLTDKGQASFENFEIRQGKITGRGSRYAEALIGSFERQHIDIGDFSGKSKSYDELLKISRSENTDMDLQISPLLIFNMLMTAIPAISLLTLLGVSRWKRKRKNSLMKTKLEDI